MTIIDLFFLATSNRFTSDCVYFLVTLFITCSFQNVLSQNFNVEGNFFTRMQEKTRDFTTLHDALVEKVVIYS